VWSERRQRHHLLAAERIASTSEASETGFLQCLDRNEGVSTPEDDERFAGGNTIDDELENGTLILRRGQPGEQQERDQTQTRKTQSAQRGHAPFGV
jgi:hypothetical protein